MNLETEIKKINNDSDLKNLVDSFLYRKPFAYGFEFKNDELFECFFQLVNIDLNTFKEKHYYYDNLNKIHLSESEKGFLWISTYGLIAKSRSTKNKYVNASCAQKYALCALIKEAISLFQNETIYDIDSRSYSIIEIITPAIFHNTVFYFETILKAYLSICKKKVPHTHRLSILLSKVKDAACEMNHKNTYFYLFLIKEVECFTKYISNLPKDFKEEYAKYDDNPNDITVVDFNLDKLTDFLNTIEIIQEIIDTLYQKIDFFFTPIDPGTFSNNFNY